MQVQTELREMFSYSFLPILIIGIAIVVVIVLIIIVNKHKNKEEIIIPPQNNMNSIKNNYLKKLKNLEEELSNNKITSRKAYQELSSLIRNFIHESTNITVQNYTLKEIKKLDMPSLYELVSEYYDPEFAKISKGNITSSIDKTRVVIEKWN